MLGRAPGDTLASMRIRRVIGAIIVAICLAVPLVEAFDNWHHTLQDENDTEMSVVVAALCVGMALSVTTTVVVRIRALGTDARVTRDLPPALWCAALQPASAVRASHPPTPLRI